MTTPWTTDWFSVVIQTQCFVQHITWVERLSQTCQHVCCIHMCSDIGTEKTNWLGTSHMDTFTCSQHQFSTALLSFLWELIYFLFSLLFVWNVHDGIEHLIYYHYSSTRIIYNLDTMNSRSMVSVNPHFHWLYVVALLVQYHYSIVKSLLCVTEMLVSAKHIKLSPVCKHYFILSSHNKT